MSDPLQTILVVEDEPILRMIAVETLEDAGWTVIEFGTADEAVAFWSEPGNPVGAIFTDVNMPGELDGLDLAALVARTHPHAVLVVTSGRHQIMPDGVAAQARFLPKPWRAEQLLAALKQVTN